MRVGYLHCFSGISGDMFLGALIGAGVSFELLRETARSLNIGADLELERVDRSGLSAVKVNVTESGREAQPQDQLSQTHSQNHTHTHQHTHEHTHDHSHEQTDDEHVHEPLPTDDHRHASAAEHSHSLNESGDRNHSHGHGRPLSEIRGLIEQAVLAPEVKVMASRAFELLGASEAKMHNVPVEQVHFHEVGAVDAIVDIVCCCAGAFSLGVDRWVCSPVNVGSGMVHCAHGNFPVPAPATLDLLQGASIYSEGPEGERVTPTGAALIRALGCSFGPLPQMRAGSTGYGAGSRNPKDSPNVLRITIGEMETNEGKPRPGHRSDTQPAVIQDRGEMDRGELVAVLETAIDDSTPQVVSYLMEAALAQGALDVMTTPAHMKKNRPGTLITILCEPADAKRFCELLFRETSTIGVRTRLDRRECLDREIVSVVTEWGEVRMKIARLNGAVMNYAPEFEDCRRLALLHDVPLKQIQRDAVSEFAKTKEANMNENGKVAGPART